ncbi:helix-turn-helix domain-containing protein [Streptomyces spectabilis]|uniref:Transcriptional regulator with XRE-family HTH domain n=1 Tax=Streptomyces spectabilis TaxID=68270 RepID=A0A7W8EZN8_STRST|nr:helix-turn-helix transcriptional regulator [Streptomyces spectabilis]MBB5108955.1 transcriptional regulator with XRE-family HTH domain [Streptomyces spectabilis]GGV50366.1 transcriptional regulator [Streptomyces spectabilis]
MTNESTAPGGAPGPVEAGPTQRRRTLGLRLLALRRASGLSAEEAGNRAGVSKATVSRYEQAKGNVRWNQVKSLCEGYGASEQETAELLELAKNSKITDGWWIPLAGKLSNPMRVLLGIENEASFIWQFTAGAVIPGLLQTKPYAEAIKATPGNDLEPDDVTEFLDMRMQRQKILTRDSPPTYHVVLDESVLHRRVGGADVMAEQLDLLLDRRRERNITIQVLPFSAGAYSAALTSFIVYGGAEPSLDVIFVETAVGSLFLEEGGTRHAYDNVWNLLRQEALNSDSSAELIAEARKTHLRTQK